MANSRATKVTLKLLVDTKDERVLFAEAGKDFVDFLFNILSLPVGTVIKLLTKQAMVGTLGNLYDSIENLSEIYFQENQNKESVLNPKPTIRSADVPLLLLDDIPSVQKQFFSCSNNRNHGYYHAYVSDNPSAICPGCETRQLSQELQYVAAGATAAKEVAAAAGEGGFVKGVVTYMVMDDLVVQPMSTISSITLLNKFNVKEVGALEEKVVDLGMPEGLKLLNASLRTKTVLTSVFLGNMEV